MSTEFGDIPGEGSLLAGKYRVESVLGSGGMGIVVAAQHVQLGQRVALKFLRASACQVPEAVERFLREARAAVQIRSEHVARVTDVGMLENGAPYMVMEYLAGRDLSAELAERGRLPVGEVVEYVLQASEAIAEAHALGIVHRDLKPSNLFLTRRADGSPLIKVLDFGISKNTSAAEQSVKLTATASIMGSPLYMSPEQVRSSKYVDARTDVWSLGVILYELVSGQPPFSGESMPAVLAQIVADAPPSVRSSCPDVPESFEHVLTRCLEKDPARRIASVANLASALRAFASPVAARSIERISRLIPETQRTLAVEPGGSGAAAPVQTHATWGQTADPAHRSERTGLIVAAVIASVVVLGGAGALLWSNARQVTAAPAASVIAVAAPPVVAPPPKAAEPEPIAVTPAPQPAEPTSAPASSAAPAKRARKASRSPAAGSAAKRADVNSSVLLDR